MGKFKFKYVMVMIITVILLNINIYGAEAIDNINFNSITIEDGLSQSTVETMLQDSNGYLWFGTNDGLNKYNGHEFKVYKNNKNKANSLISNYIIDIKEGKDKSIWVGTIGGVSRINPIDDTVKNYTLDQGLSNNNVCEILITRDGSVFIATDDGLNLYDEESDRFNRIFYNEGSITGQSIYSLDEDRDGNLWLGTTEGLNKVNIKDDSVEKFLSTGSENSISDNWIYKVYSGRDNYVWVATYSKGLNRIDIDTGEVKVFKNDPQNKKSLASNYVKDILKDSNGTIWACTDSGLSKYVEEKDIFVNYTHKPYDRYSIIDNKTFSIIEDENGLIIVGTYRGVSIFDPNNKIEHYKNDPFDNNSLSNNMVFGVYEGTKGFIWSGTSSSGVNVIDRNTGDIYHFREEHGLLSDSINSIDGYGDYVWIGTNTGLNKVEKSSGKVTNYCSTIIGDMNIKCLFMDSNKTLWIGSSDGIFALNTETDEVRDLNYVLQDNGITDDCVWTIHEDREGNIWLGTFLEGYLICIDMKNNEVRSYEEQIDSKAVRTITDDEDYMWIGTSDGLYRMDKKTRHFMNFTEEDGLCNNNIYGILIDKHGHLWMSTNNGISKLDTIQNKFINFYLEDGLQSNEFNANSAIVSSHDELVFGGINGINIFNPEEITSGAKCPKVVFNGFNVKGEPYKSIDNLELKHDQNSIGINFFIPIYKNVQGVQYQYMLEGVDKDWNFTNTTEIIYNNLDSGKYKFRIRARNHNGILSEENSVSFTINQPFWKSWTAITIYLVSIIFFIYHGITRVKRLDKLVDKRTRQLSNEMHKNNRLLNRVIQLERNKNNYFVNLSHELRTPMNVIFATIQLISSLNKKNNEELTEEKLDYYMDIMRRNAERLLKLINNIIDVSKVEYGNYNLNIKLQDIVYIVEETALGLKDYIENKNIQLVIEPDVEEKYIECDRYEIERCIVNLISNAAKFTPEGGRIDVLIKELGSKVEIVVKDTGVGIDKKYHDIIFDRFNQVIDDESEVKGGSGLGLTITKRIIELHKGTISVESELGKGSEFKIVLNEKIS